MKYFICWQFIAFTRPHYTGIEIFVVHSTNKVDNSMLLQPAVACLAAADKILKFEVSDTVHLFSMDERRTNLMQLLYIFIVAVGDAVHVSGVFAHRQER
jgi:hypothetical protein